MKWIICKLFGHRPGKNKRTKIRENAYLYIEYQCDRCKKYR